jgi:hypothetical protein
MGFCVYFGEKGKRMEGKRVRDENLTTNVWGFVYILERKVKERRKKG